MQRSVTARDHQTAAVTLVEDFAQLRAVAGVHQLDRLGLAEDRGGRCHRVALGTSCLLVRNDKHLAPPRLTH
jgi:hypothetical protein